MLSRFARLSLQKMRRASDGGFHTWAHAAAMAHYSEKRMENCVHSLLRRLGLSHAAFRSAMWIALIPALVGAAVSLLARYTDFWPFIFLDPGYDGAFDIDSSVYQGLSFVLGFLLVFRASMAYSRYWEAITSVHLMRAEWFDAASSLVSFSAYSKAPPETILKFRHLLVRLFSLCHVGALHNLIGQGAGEKLATGLRVIDPLSLDEETLYCYGAYPQRVEMVGQWIQQTIVRAMDDEVLSAPPPIITRSFQEFANGMVRYHDALKAKQLQFPEAYQNMCDVLLGLHWIGAPFLVSLYCNSAFLTFLFTYLTVFAFWSLSLVAKVIENPFRSLLVTNEVAKMQNDMNAKLLMLLDPKVVRAPEVPNLQVNENTLSSAKLVPLAALGMRGSADINGDITASMQVSADRDLRAKLRVPGEDQSTKVEIPVSAQVSPGGELAVTLQVSGGIKNSDTDRTLLGRTFDQQPAPCQQHHLAPEPWLEGSPAIYTASTTEAVPLRRRNGPTGPGTANDMLGSTFGIGRGDGVSAHSPQSLHGTEGASECLSEEEEQGIDIEL